MKLTKDNKASAGFSTEDTTMDRVGEFPDFMEEYIAKLPPATMNNSRKIVRADFRRILKLHPITAEKILAEKYNMHPDGDRTAKDYGEPRNDREDLPF